MKILKKIWERIYHYFNPPLEETLRHWGIIDYSKMTPEEWEECEKGIEKLYEMIDAWHPSKDECPAEKDIPEQ